MPAANVKILTYILKTETPGKRLAPGVRSGQSSAIRHLSEDNFSTKYTTNNGLSSTVFLIRPPFFVISKAAGALRLNRRPRQYYRCINCRGLKQKTRLDNNPLKSSQISTARLNAVCTAFPISATQPQSPTAYVSGTTDMKIFVAASFFFMPKAVTMESALSIS